MSELEIRDGWLIPSAVQPGFMDKWIREAKEHIELVLPYLKGRNHAIQAGGNLGIWPRMLVREYGFKRVTTFEPDETNFRCLLHNTASLLQVEKINTALGEEICQVKWARASAHKPGWHKIAPPDYKKTASVVMVDTIDNLHTEECDFIALDVEGYELPALRGAKATIEKFRPVILFEDLGNSQSESFRKKSGTAYGFDPGSTQLWLVNHGYEKVTAIQNDEVWVPR